MKFKKGNKLRLRTFEDVHKNGPDGHNYSSSMVEKFGTMVTLSKDLRVDSNYISIEDSDYGWHIKWFKQPITVDFSSIQRK